MSALIGFGIFVCGVICGVFLIALVSANREDDDEN